MRKTIIIIKDKNKKHNSPQHKVISEPKQLNCVIAWLINHLTQACASYRSPRNLGIYVCYLNPIPLPAVA